MRRGNPPISSGDNRLPAHVTVTPFQCHFTVTCATSFSASPSGVRVKKGGPIYDPNEIQTLEACAGVDRRRTGLHLLARCFPSATAGTETRDNSFCMGG